MVPTTRARRPRLETVRRRLDRWRQARPHRRAPLPPRLWAAAVALVPEHGLYGTARALHLDYGTLKRRVDALDRDARDRMTASFIALPPATDRDACVIEVEGARTTVRLRLNGLALTDLAELTRLVVGPAA
jgi:hypothetical protein